MKSNKSKSPQQGKLDYRFQAIILAVAAIYWLMVWQQAEASTIAANSGQWNEPRGGQLLMKSDGHESPALTLSTDVQIDITGLMAKVSVTQRFRNDGSEWAEGIYQFPLPHDAAVNRMRMTIGDRVIEGEIKEKAEAKRIYKAAARAGKTASLVEQQRPNLFSNRVANIAPGETIEIRIDYVQSVVYDMGEFSLRFPSTITPRYMPGSPLPKPDHLPMDDLSNQAYDGFDSDFGWSSNTDQVADAAAISPFLNPQLPTDSDPINRLSIEVSLAMGMNVKEVRSAYHEVVVDESFRDSAAHYAIRFKKANEAADRDFELRWFVRDGEQPKAAVFTEQKDGEHYAMLMLLPPQQLGDGKQIAKEVVYIIDTSGSMQGQSIKQARDSLELAIARLRPQDRFNIVEFNSTHRTLFSDSVAASAKNIRTARAFVRGLNAGGGTNMAPALEAALVGDDAEAEGVRQVVFITDGAVGNEAALMGLIETQLGRSRLFTVGIGSAPNSYFMAKAAKLGKGSQTHIGSVAEVGEKMQQLFAKLESPVLSDIVVDWPLDLTVDSIPAAVPDLYLGEPLMVSAKIEGPTAKDFTVGISGNTADRPWYSNLRVMQGSHSTPVGTLWGRRKIAEIMEGKWRGVEDSELRQQVLPIALRHQLVSAYTSFVAVEQVIRRPSGEGVAHKPVPNLRPKGQAPQPFAYPQGGTGSMQSILLGCLILMMAVFARTMRRGDEYVYAD